MNISSTLSQMAKLQLLMTSGNPHNGRFFMFTSAVLILRMKICHSD